MRLRDFLHNTCQTQRELAEKLGVTIVTVNRWCNGARIPSARFMGKIKRLTGGLVTADDFYRDGQTCDKQ